MWKTIHRISIPQLKIIQGHVKICCGKLYNWGGSQLKSYTHHKNTHHKNKLIVQNVSIRIGASYPINEFARALKTTLQYHILSSLYVSNTMLWKCYSGISKSVLHLSFWFIRYDDYDYLRLLLRIFMNEKQYCHHHASPLVNC